ncbi:CS domain protein, putative [Babesia caballi]|uniref:CS domain protein, putative n=1 Tax=Babesia caballi TaxID=5871 RepID=A0AAV4LRQ1_BABCB|nr:CS domain protein, putative [Babesia caballi]
MIGTVVAVLAAAVCCKVREGSALRAAPVAIPICSGSTCLLSCGPRRAAFLNLPWRPHSKSRASALYSGWGRTERYSWNEDARHVYVSAVLESTVSAGDLDVTIRPNALHVINRNKPMRPIVSGETKGSIDVDESFWTLEDASGMRELRIKLAKAEKDTTQWFGVIRNEVVQQQTYDPVTHHDTSATSARSLEPGGIFWQRNFPMIDAPQLEEMLKRWMGRESTDMIPFGKPKLPISVDFIPDNEGGKIVYQNDNPEIDEYLDVVITPVITKENKHSGGGSQMTLVNSPSTKIISGEMGAEQAHTILTALQTLVQTFEKDVHRLDGLMKHRQEQADSFDYMGSAAYLDADNLESYVKYHEGIKALSPAAQKKSDPSKVFKDLDAGVTIDWNPTDDEPGVSEKENEEKKKMLINQLTAAVKNTQRPQPEETVKSLVENVRRALALNDVEYDQLLQRADDRISRENAELAEKQRLYSQMKSVAALEEAQPSVEELVTMENRKTNADTFDMAMQHPERSMLAKKYETISSVQRDQLRRRWKTNEKRLKLLITELLGAPAERCPTICNNYRDLLISEDYPTLMRSYLCFNQVNEPLEKERLTFLNEFVVSLYKDQQIYLLHDEKLQLQKIRQIILWARTNFEDLNDLIVKNKRQYDRNFMCYLNLAISKEVERIRDECGTGALESGSATPEAQPWLCVLTIVQRAVNAMVKADMAEDLYLISCIVSFKDPLMRSYMLEFILATMPRSDWKAFKDLILSASNSLIRRPPDERDDLKNTQPHFVEAVKQIREEVERMIPDWIIDALLSEDDRNYMIQNNVSGKQRLTVTFVQRRKPQSYRIDRAQLNKQYKAFQFELHPDRHAAKQHEEIELINSNASVVNGYYRALLDDKQRAKMLFCLKYGEEEFSSGLERTDPAQLEEIMEVHEKVDTLQNPEEAKQMQQHFERILANAVQALETAFNSEAILPRCAAAFAAVTRSAFCAHAIRRFTSPVERPPSWLAGTPASIASTRLGVTRFHTASDARGCLEPTVETLDRQHSPLDCGTLFVVKVPAIGNGITHGKIHEWHKRTGDHVDVGDLICVLETEQVYGKVHSQVAGVIVETVGNEGCRVRVGGDLTIIRKDEEPEEESDEERE